MYVLAVATPVVRTRRWSRLEYERLIDLGVFTSGENLELVDGLLLVREPQNARHATAVRAVHEALRRVFRPGWDVRPQSPIALDAHSQRLRRASPSPICSSEAAPSGVGR